MRRTTALTVTTLLGLALLSPTHAGAAGETCRGEAATIVGAPGTRLVGTEGRDVVVTNGSAHLETGAGDDLICVTGRELDDGGTVVYLHAGAGDDVVDGTGRPTLGVAGSLGAGSDRFDGGPGPDRLTTGGYAASDAPYLDSEVDVVHTGGGDDHVSSGVDETDNADVVDTGAGDDSISFSGRQAPGAAITGGEGSDTLVLELEPGPNVVDATARQLTSNGVVRRGWSEMEGFAIPEVEDTWQLYFRGSSADERLYASSLGVLHAAMGGGDDAVHVRRLATPGSDIDGGAGRDLLTMGTLWSALELDLADGILHVGATGSDMPDHLAHAAYDVATHNLEGAHLMAPRVRLVGTDHRDELFAFACRGVVDGRGGDDVVQRLQDVTFDDYHFRICREELTLIGGSGRDELKGSPGDDRISGGPGEDTADGLGGADLVLGGPGNDRLSGRRGRDELVGGPGRDLADGHVGRDRCNAELERRCER